MISAALPCGGDGDISLRQGMSRWTAASSFCFILPRQLHDIYRHVFAAKNFRRHHSASSASSTFHAAGRAVARNVPAALACGFLVDRWALLRLGAGNNRNLT
jgi:hypothetical protein